MIRSQYTEPDREAMAEYGRAVMRWGFTGLFIAGLCLSAWVLWP